MRATTCLAALPICCFWLGCDSTTEVARGDGGAAGALAGFPHSGAGRGGRTGTDAGGASGGEFGGANGQPDPSGEPATPFPAESGDTSGDGAEDSRIACLQPPWVLAADDERVETVACSDMTETAFKLPGSTPASPAEQSAFLDQSRERIHGVAGVIGSGWGLCCEGEWSEADPRCIAIDIKLCTTEVAILLEQLLQSQQENPATAELSFNISLTHVGALTPRCELGECGPIPYDETVQNDVPELRSPVYDVATDTAPCRDDSECQTGGCGNECVHWTESGGFGTCDYRAELTNAFCGCVEERCAWFE